jgi:hypothetical protein
LPWTETAGRRVYHAQPAVSLFLCRPAKKIVVKIRDKAEAIVPDRPIDTAFLSALGAPPAGSTRSRVAAAAKAPEAPLPVSFPSETDDFDFDPRSGAAPEPTERESAVEADTVDAVAEVEAPKKGKKAKKMTAVEPIAAEEGAEAEAEAEAPKKVKKVKKKTSVEKEEEPVAAEEGAEAEADAEAAMVEAEAEAEAPKKAKKVKKKTAVDEEPVGAEEGAVAEAEAEAEAEAPKKVKKVKKKTAVEQEPVDALHPDSAQLPSAQVSTLSTDSAVKNEEESETTTAGKKVKKGKKNADGSVNEV